MKKLRRILKNMVLFIFPSSSVLMLHKVTVEAPEASYNLSQANFYKLIDSFSNWATMDDVVLNKKKGKITLTFDDISEDVFTVAYPYLKKKNIPFTVFITLDLIDKEGYITKQQFDELLKDPLVTIGGHCYQHIPLPSQNKKEQEYQLQDSFDALAGLSGNEIRYFAYPYGQYNDVTLKILKERKTYSYAFFGRRRIL